MDEKLQPTVREFKHFLGAHPQLIKEVRKSGRSWQEYYEKWALLGEDDAYWDKYKETDDMIDADNKGGEGDQQSQLFGQLLKMTENMDFDKVQKQVQQLNSTISTIQDVLGQFQETRKSTPFSRRKPNGIGSWFRD